MTSVEQCKEDIANKYLEKFRSELNFFEKAMILPITGKMKEILKSNKKIDAENFSSLEDLGFRRKVLGVKIGDKEVFEGLVNKTFKFLKENQERILEAQTQGKLEVLLESVINGKLDDLNQNVNQSGESNQTESQQNQTGGELSEQSEGGNGNQNESQQNQVGEETSQQIEGESSTQNEGNKKGRDVKDHAIEAGVGTAVIGGLGYKKGIAEAEKRLGLTPKEIPTEFNAEQSKKMLRDLANQMKDQVKNNPKLNRAQKFTYKKSIKAFEEAANSLDGKTAIAFQDWQKIGGKMPPDFLKHINIDHNILNMIDALPDEELVKIVGKSEKEIVEILGKKGIKISEDFAKSLKLAGNVQEIKQLTNIARNGRKLSNFLRGVKGMGVITFLFMGLDAWFYFDASKEADLVKKINEVRGEIIQDEATKQLLIGVGGVLLEALTLAGVCISGASAAGPIGTCFGVAVGVAVGVYAMITSSRYEKKGFYAQNRYDFINKKRAEVKQSIVQLFESDRLGMHESMKESIKDARGPNSDVNTMEDAWEALIYQEEIKNGVFEYLPRYYSSGKKEEDFLKELSDEDKDNYNREKDKMEKIINTRMTYIKKYISVDTNSPEYQKMKESIKNGGGLSCVEQILADSKVYEYLNSDDNEPYIENYKTLDVAGYKEAYKNKLSSEYPDEFKIFEQLRRDNPILLDEICRGATLSKSTITSYIESSEDGISGDETEEQNEGDKKLYTEDQIKNIKKNLNFIEKYIKYKDLGVAQESKFELGLTDISLDYNYIEQVLIDFHSISKRPKRDKDISLKYLTTQEFMTRNDERKNEVSGSLFQNILYDIAKTIHGYQGRNNKEELISFYALSGDVTGIYMDGNWKVNEDWEIDLTINNPDHMSKEAMLKTIVGEVELDSAVEAADKKLTQEVREKIKDIINKEFSYREKRGEYEKKLTAYIKSQEGQGYIEIPNDLSYECRKAGIGEVYNYLFSYEDGEIKALGRGDLVNKTLNFGKTNTKVSYEVMNKLRESYTQDEKLLIDEVDHMEKKLLNIRKVEGFGISGTKEDELDIPAELERVMSKRSGEWNDIKETILYMEPYSVRDYLAEKAKIYHDYFEGMYIGLLTEVTKKRNFLNSNDVDEIDEFLQASSFSGLHIIKVEKGEISLTENVDKKIGKYLLQLLDEYKDNKSGKSVKELLLSEDENSQIIGQELAKKLYSLCLEETVIERYSGGNISDFTMKDMSNNDFKKVKNKMNSEISTTSFNELITKVKEGKLVNIENITTRKLESGEIKVHEKVNDVTDNIINRMNHIDWAGIRKNPKFEVDENQQKEGEITGKLKSRGYEENMTIIINGNDIKKVIINDLDIGFTNLEEGIRTANLINFIQNNAKEHPRGSGAPKIGHLERYQWSNGGGIERDVRVDMGLFDADSPANVDVVYAYTINKYYPTIKKSKKFLDYINKFL